MSEHLPEQDPEETKPRYFYTYGEIQMAMTPNNCDVFIFYEEPWYDHIYIKLPEQFGGRGVAFWRIDHDNFDDVAVNLVEQGLEPYEDTHAPESDKEYFKACGKELPVSPGSAIEEPSSIEEIVPEIELRWISPRNDELIKKTVEYILYLAAQGKLLDE